jgi:SAM-dependent methyltransferase
LHNSLLTSVGYPDCTTRDWRRLTQHVGFQRSVGITPSGDGIFLEIGSGWGGLAEHIPNLITSEIFFCPYVRAVLDGQSLPFHDGALRGILMTDVLHHIPRVRQSLAEAARCVRAGGVLTMIEPWATRWSRFIYQNFHHEPFNPRAAVWELPTSGPLAGANGALPWIIFQRDRELFEHDFPQWKLETIRPMMPFRYLVSGGVSFRPLMPSWSYSLWSGLEKLLAPWMDSWAMFAQITLRRISAQ